MRTAMIVLALASLGAQLDAQIEWTRHSTAYRRLHVRMVFDSVRGRLVAIHGTENGVEPQDSVLESDGGPWERVTPANAGPGPLQSHAIAFDTARGVTVLFGGLSPGVSGPVGETWTWDGARWTRAADGPAARWGSAAVYDSARQRVVLFGGLTGPGIVARDTWEWDGTAWTQRAPATVPPGRWGHAMGYDPVRQRVVMFAGGYFGAPSVGETWEWDGNDWSLRTPASSPPQRVEHAMAWDAARGRILMHGGSGVSGGRTVSDQTWEWDGNDWLQRQPANPVQSSRHALVFDPRRQRVVMYGSFDHTLFHEWDGNDWVIDAQRSLPWSTYGAALSWDARRDRVLMYGGTGTPQEALWAFDGASWRLVDSGFATTGLAPDDRLGAAWAYDVHRDVHVLFGGFFGVHRDDVWEFDGTRWRQPAPATRPPARRRHAFVYDAGRRTMLLFSGETRTSYAEPADTWEWDGATWTERTPPVAPTGRQDAAIAYDPIRGRVVLFGGYGRFTAAFGDTWEWDGATWIESQPVHAPSARSGAVMSWDAARRRAVLVGGVTSDRRVWEWDGVDWTPRGVATPLPPRQRMGFAFDAARGVHVGFDGRTIGTEVALGDTWTLAPVDPAVVDGFGTGCPPGGSHTLTAAWLPWIGTTLELVADGFAPGTAVVVWCGFSNTAWSGGRLPQSLAAIGMPGCDLLVAPDVALAAVAGGGAPTATLPLPADPSLVGVALYFQAFGAEPAANPLGLAATAGLAAVLGAR